MSAIELVRGRQVLDSRGNPTVEAEVLAKDLFFLGERAAVATDIPCVLVTTDGRTILGGGLS